MVNGIAVFLKKNALARQKGHVFVTCTRKLRKEFNQILQV